MFLLPVSVPLAGTVPEHQPSDILSRDERAWLNSHSNRLVLGVDPAWRNMEQESPGDQFSGMEVDFIEAMTKNIGAKYTFFSSGTWTGVVHAAKTGLVDILPVVRKESLPGGGWLFTAPYIEVPVVLLVRTPRKGSFTVDEMTRMRLAVGKKYALDHFVRSTYPRLALVPIKSDIDGLLDLSVGDIDVLVMDLESASRLITKHKITNLMVTGRIGPLYDFSMACSAENTTLYSIINKGLASITSEQKRAIVDKWINLREPPFFKSRVFWAWFVGVMGAVAAGFMVVLAWNLTLKRQVAQTTHELVQELAERKRAEEELSLAHAELDLRVKERTRELAVANEQLTREIAYRRRAESEVLEISNIERKRIGRDLHDSLGQELAGVACLCEAMATRIVEQSPALAVMARRIATVVGQSIVQAKYIVRGLMPVEIVKEGLSYALKRLAEETSGTAAVVCRFESDVPSPVYDNDVATNLYRIAQEATANAIKHGKAQNITITLKVNDLNGRLSIEDDGCGLHTDLDATTGMGVRIMRYRAEMCGGKLCLDPLPGGGTAVTCTFRDHQVASAFDPGPV